MRRTLLLAIVALGACASNEDLSASSSALMVASTDQLATGVASDPAGPADPLSKAVWEKSKEVCNGKGGVSCSNTENCRCSGKPPEGATYCCLYETK